MKITVEVPRIPLGFWSNTMGIVGLIAIMCAVGGLTQNAWWAVLTGGIFTVALTVIGQLEPEADSRDKPAGASEQTTREIPRLSERRTG